MRTFPGRGHLYDLAVVGAGLAGSEAALAAARAGCDVLLVTTSLDTLYMLAHGDFRLEPAPGTLMEELLAEEPDGPIGRWELHRAAKYALEVTTGIHLLQSNVTGLIVEEGRAVGVRTWEGVERRARATALCVGSFLGSRLEQGSLREVAGRLGEMSYDELYDDLQGLTLPFETAVASLDDPAEGPAYRVEYRVLGGGLAEDGMSVDKVPGLFAAGVCARGPQRYEESADEGRLLGLSLAERLKSADSQ